MNEKIDIEKIIPDVEWTNSKRLIKDLKPHPKNPRVLSKHSHAKLIESLSEFNYVETAVINLDNQILAGHQRIYCMQDIGWGDREIDVRIPSRKLTRKEADKYLLMSNKVSGDWDWDILADQWEEEQLIEAGFLKQEIYGKEETLVEPEIDESELKDKLDTFNNATIKQIVLYFPNEIYEKVLKTLDYISQEINSNDNSETVIKLISFWEFNNGKKESETLSAKLE
jgi:hypothetical protein